MKKKGLIVGIISIILIILLFILIFVNQKDSPLKSIGYSSLEISEIEKLTKDEIDIISKHKYNKNLIYIIKSEKYNPNKLDLYLKYINKYSNIDYLKIFELINNKDFKEEKIEDYTSLLKNYDNVEYVVNYVNNYSDKAPSEVLFNIINQKYFIDEYLDRYLNYYNSNSNLDYKEIITRVNSNLDHVFYVDIKKADTSKGMYTLVNKYNYLDQDFVPEDIVNATSTYTSGGGQLNKTAYENFVKMADAARNDGLCLKITTGYRSYNFQATLYNNYVRADGVENADTYSARPGYSEHQLGYSADLTNASLVDFGEFEYTEEYNWLQKHAHEYGFILRYPKDKEYITGYIYESWHYRYVGTEIAKYIHENNITYEEYYEYFLR